MKRYLTTTLPYVNADPHIGFALEIVQADALARAWRLQGDEVFFNTGTDEHGQKIWEAAKKAGKSIEAYTDYYSDEVKNLRTVLNLSTDAFIRTTDTNHIAAAKEMWRRCDARGDIYKKSYTGLYCVGCELYKTERELENGHCTLHPSLTLEEITEENYFFRFSKYERDLLQYLEGDAVIVPEWRREEAIAFVKKGLEDFSISRSRERLSWGVMVPGDEAQVMYVWFDALTSYISTLGWPNEEGNFKEFWQEGKVVQMAGKDQVRFQSLMWQAMLMSAGIKNTDQVFYHGFINSGGQRMSKSLGNVISPYDLVTKYGTDATRYLLLRHVHPIEDSDVTWERLDEWYTANLVNGLGNLVARIMKLAEDNLDAPVSLLSSLQGAEEITRARETYHFNAAIDGIFSLVAALDERITREQPFKLVKTDADAGKGMIAGLVQELDGIAFLLTPYMPDTAKAIQTAVRENKKPENLFPRLG